VTRRELERAAFIAPFADGEAVASRALDRGGGGQAFFLAVSNPENAKNCRESFKSPEFDYTATFIPRFQG
jgi:hypothetical protein